MSKLAARIEEFDIPPIPYLPLGKNVILFRMPAETTTAGGLIIPETEWQPKPEGVLLAAGLNALDILRDNLIELGDVVWFGRFAGWDKEVKRDPANKGKAVVQMKVEDILGSVDAVSRVYGGRATHHIDFDSDADDGNGQHVYKERQ